MLGLAIGTRVYATRQFVLDGFTTVQQGEQGEVTACDTETGETWITLDKVHPGLAEYQNAVWITHPWTSEFADAFETSGGTMYD